MIKAKIEIIFFVNFTHFNIFILFQLYLNYWKLFLTDIDVVSVNSNNID